MISRHLERRTAKRIPVRIDAFLLTGNHTYAGFIENVSEDGFEYFIPSFMKGPDDIHKGNTVEIYFQMFSGEVLHLFCEVKWLSDRSPVGKPLTVGMKTTDLPFPFRGFLRTLDIVNVN